MNPIRIVLALAALALTGCASTQASNPADPLEPLNRGVYQFNDVLDKAVTKPVAQGYNKVMPEVGKIMVANFFSNLDDAVVTANDLLQFKLTQAASDGSRFLFNSTFGVLGLFNVTSRLEKHNEDFGQTLGYWGIASGPYLVLPVLGPSTLRDGIGDIGDSQVSLLARTSHVRTRNQMYLLKAVKRRAQLLTQESVLEGAMIDRYAFIRDAYLQRRQNLVYDGNPPHEDYDDEESDFEYQPDAPAMPVSGTEPAVAPTATDPAPPAQNHDAHKH
jgi:phospholipid-binding lipoprotein MlaA